MEFFNKSEMRMAYVAIKWFIMINIILFISAYIVAYITTENPCSLTDKAPACGAGNTGSIPVRGTSE